MLKLEHFKNYAKKIRSYYVLIVLIIVFIAFSFIIRGFFSIDNLLYILRQSTLTGIIAIGMTFIILTGGIDLSVGAVVALSGFLAGSFARIGLGVGILSNFDASSITGNNKFLMVFIPIIIGIAVGGICGAVNGLLVVYGKIAPFIATLGMLSLARGAVYVISEGSPVYSLNSHYLTIGGGSFLGIPIPLIIFIAIAIIGSLLINFTRFGRYLYAIGGNETQARLLGIRVNSTKMAVYIISGLLCGLAGVILSARVMAGTPVAGTGYEFAAIAATVIGGTSLYGGIGTIRGTVVGILLMGILSNALTVMFVSTHFQQIIVGIIIIIAVVFYKK